MEKLKGVLCPMVTLIDEKENIDEISTRKLVRRLIDKKIDGLFLLGTQGEGPMIVEEEKKRLVEIVVDEVGGEIPVLANISDQGRRKTERVYDFLKDTGADAYILTPPGYYNLRDDREFYDYYKYFLNIVNKPIMIYNCGYTNNLLPKDTVIKLADEKKIIGFKGGNDFTVMRECGGRSDFSIFSGDEKNLDMGLMLGADGIIPGLSSFLPDMYVALYKSAKSNEYKKAFVIQKDLHEIQNAVFGNKGQHWGNGHKYALSLLGIGQPNIATTLMELTQEDKNYIKGMIEKYDLT